MPKEKYKICVIDDIKNVVHSIVKHVPWHELGIVIAGTAGNGEEGVALILSERPHIVLTDIRMPKLDGLAMIRGIVNQLPNCKVIIMSGYSDFQYAQEAIRLGAFDFLTKPVTPNEVREVMQRVVGKLDEELLQTTNIQVMQSRVKESMSLFKQEYLNLLVRHPTQRLDADKQREIFKPDMQMEQFAVMVAEIDGMAEINRKLPVREVELYRFTIHNIMEETMSAFCAGVVFRDFSENRYIALFNPPASPDIGFIAETVREHIDHYSRYTVSIGVGEAVQQVSDIPITYEQALKALSYNFYSGGNSTYRFRDIKGKDEMILMHAPESEKEFLLSIRSGNKEKALGQLQQIIDSYFTENRLPRPEQWLETFTGIVYLMKKEMMSHRIAELDQDELVEVKEWSIQDVRTVQQLRGSLITLCETCCDWVNRQRKKEAGHLIHQAVAYIRSSLHLNPSVSDCAASVHVSPSHFANIFRKVMGMPVNQFITQEKMDEAKELLIRDMQVKDVAEALGYADRAYFTELFKKNTGMTPSEYKMDYLNSRH